MKTIHKILTIIMGVLFILSISAMDSEALWIPATTLFISGGWLTFYAYKKGWMFNSIEDGEEE